MLSNTLYMFEHKRAFGDRILGHRRRRAAFGLRSVADRLRATSCRRRA
jgi:hypothetical protein